MHHTGISNQIKTECDKGQKNVLRRAEDKNDGSVKSRITTKAFLKCFRSYDQYRDCSFL